MVVYLAGLLSLLLGALSLGPSFAHVLEAPPRLFVWSPELWREATVFNGQFALFAKVGGPLDVATILATCFLSYLLSNERPAFWFALAGGGFFAGGLAAWFTLVAPANAILATWPGPIPADFEAVRLRWETGHMAVAALKVLGFGSISVALLAPRLGSG
ncbi:DUF1772 domain-containing protein [Sinorhizobium medicae]|nr:DUF1772 domain-containing protein [Sinorhizobium medicae]MDX0612385.1 DUF1772 domain-containing protein [Sinorhizobium medicae]MDX0704030.1 DUF1772 domain-containing protein [Sinorhizobium medicae]MDX0758784.1 DUF1772 domain-containing protein [Sinorhizobium medicae]MDX0795611.1 DUF1772 domain-containing protein [Sinorhizobium medicae]